jgi:UDP-N-acetylmuramate--alanine ligase
MQAQPASTREKNLLNRPNPQPLVLEKTRPVHFIGVGGVGMSALAKILLEQGYPVSGSDAKESAYLTMLRDRGGKVYAQHEASQVPQGAIVVTSSAIDTENPEVKQAQELGLPLYHRSDMLREILKLHETAIGLTGTHGKTTMTGMTGVVLEAGGLDPTIIAGGKIPQLNTNAKAGKDLKYAVAELDESDGTVVQYQPAISVIANLELDHPDHYQDGLEAIRQTFREYLGALGRDNTVLFNMDCPETKALYREFAGRIEALKLYADSVPEEPDGQSYYCQNVVLHPEGGYQGDFHNGYDWLGTLWLQVPGRHNLGNAMFAAAIGHRLGVPFDTIRRALEDFKGMGRRFEQLGKYNGARVVDDYAHHPTEVKATLKAAREFNLHRGRVIAMFQPHRYQRLQSLWDEFLEAFEDADEVIVTDVYAAGESPVEGVDSKHFVDRMDHPAAEYWPTGDWDLVVARLKTMLTPDDLFITLGAGDITQVGRMLVSSQ